MRALPFWAWCVMALFLTCLYTVSVPVIISLYELNLVTAFTITTVQCGSLVLAIFRPRPAVVVHLASVVALVLATRHADDEPWPLPIPAMLSLGALILLLGLRERWPTPVVTWWSSVVVLIGLIVANPARYQNPDQWGTNLSIYAGYTATVLVAAIALGQRRRIRAELAAARRGKELVEERARIARELHDVVAHSMSLIHMQAMSAPIRLRGADPATIDGEFRDIARGARTALDEMRQLLGVLRSDDADRQPQPGLGDLDELIAATSRAGIPIRLAVDPVANEASPLVQLTIYRIVQEALSNVVRHAPAAATEVIIKANHVSVRNEAPATATPSPDRGGQGLRGMRERVMLLGGRLTTEPTTDGGYLVEATIPAPSEQP
ncbi:hypothetical protein KOI35_32185 [Actinoplanes bogorensis]|uniref:histidine kinase n=1 Tax=Paractinoplanes bogorensis TaxID=1610840 RepID=A0ABS5YYL7_9ACTN|nr:histidine kinase [Actinoplanes bogorensis]MBU2668181.1 hypothetical protein [Actinoplanes bogorensis]